ncbi:WD40-repeat-containing domain protein [Lipomyces oligophaga]|uniref:WD40-repeat-containing domain protein n=1 Tax=Lipomyces oligophaga TaxID=45792 RepID=UPI0034CE4D82
MFVLPPPPKFPTGSPAYAAAIAQMRDNNVDAHNTLKFPTGDEFMFATGEGTYVLREDIRLATPPPHPSEITIINPNPLATTPAPVSAGVRISLCCIKYRNDSNPSVIYRTNTNQLTATDTRSSGGSDYDERLSDINSLAAATTRSMGLSASLNSQSQISSTLESIDSASNNNALMVMLSNASGSSSKDKKRRPKMNMAKGNSSFVSRLTTHEHLSKRLAERSSEDLFFFANVNRSFNWLDFASPTLKHEPLTKILFTKAHVISHDVNQATKSSSHIDLILGFSTSDIIWYDPISARYNRLNKAGCMNSSACVDIRWISGSENLVMAAFLDGSIMIIHNEKEDSNFADDFAAGNLPDSCRKPAKDGFQVVKSIHSANRASKSNPLAYWKVSRRPLTSFAFSPDGQYIAVISEDGYLRIIDFLKEKVVDVFSSYYGGFLCVCWSPDGRYLLTGGQDDLVSVWSFATRTLVARCQGHQSFVRSVAFDPWRCDERTLRFGSVGDDCRLLLWDLSIKALHRPRGSVNRGSVSSRFSNTSRPYLDIQNIRSTRVRSDSNAVAADDDDAYHPIASKSSVPIIPPVLSKQVDPDPVTSLHFLEDSIIITCHDGHIRTWNRPGVRTVEGVIQAS